MTFEVTITNRQRALSVDRRWFQDMAESVAEAVLNNLIKAPPDWLDRSILGKLQQRGQLSLVLVSNRQIRKLNREWRDKDRATDVLSFPLELEPPPPGLPWEIGEVVISTEKAAEQADSYGHELERELAFLFAHGLLHVLGFDHETPEQEADMFGRQKKVLKQAGFTR